MEEGTNNIQSSYLELTQEEASKKVGENIATYALEWMIKFVNEKYQKSKVYTKSCKVVLELNNR